uniref:Uncharacterized protein n=1 Tax=Anguilla anguilla TaxID=7936 RepID=A0A0E9QNF5_ANGAN
MNVCVRVCERERNVKKCSEWSIKFDEKFKNRPLVSKT